VTGELRPLPQFERADGQTAISMEFDAFQSFFVVFSERNQNAERALANSAKPGEAPAGMAEGTPDTRNRNGVKNFADLKSIQKLRGAWDVAFDPKWGGPAQPVVFNDLTDWSDRSDSGIKYYSGIATYRKSFSLAQVPTGKTYLDLGIVRDMARVKLNDKDLGVVWCAPWRIEVTSAIKAGDNKLEIEVVNRWANRLIGDKQPADANVRTVECPPGFLGGQTIKAGRYTFSTHDPYNAQSPLVASGLLGPLRILTMNP
jgi:hypothetical protein